ncbi:MAG TPA: UvrD-helicase domain-containing protein [Anaerolineae bacterium]|nr:UvrD-helicase domain-containing protein [Anaerolineae bacterium]
MELAPIQQAAAEGVGSSLLLGPAGSGKTTALQHRLLTLLESGESAYTVLVIIAEQEHGQGFLDMVHRSGLGPYAELNIATYNTLARQMVSLFWPLIARPAGFERPYLPPTFLSYDLAQLLMWRVITPMLDDGAFANLRLRPQQIVSQLLDTLNRAALNGLTLEEATTRQIVSWAGAEEQRINLQEAAGAARHFRDECLTNNLLDLSLLVEVFDRQLIGHSEFQRYFSERFRHLMVDNIEEQTPAGQNFVASLMIEAVTTAIAYDAGGGYKRFLAADPAGANRFYNLCESLYEFDASYTAPEHLLAISNLVENQLMSSQQPAAGAQEAVIDTVIGRYRREMVHDLVARLADLVGQGLPPSEIAIIAPYLDGALRFTLTHALSAAGLPYYLLRRRSSPREEPRVRAWLTWLALGHPGWGIHPAPYDVAEAFNLSIDGMDPVRAKLLTDHIYQVDRLELRDSSALPPPVAERLGPDLLERADALSAWLADEGDERHPLDVFLHRLFNDLLARPLFRPQPDLAAAAICDWLVRSAGRLLSAAEPMGLKTPSEIGRAFIAGIYDGLVTADPPELGEPPDLDGVLISTIYGYLLGGRPVEVQVWLEAAATGWWDIPRQPLSNAFVLAQSWPADRLWTMEDDFKIRNQLLSRIVRGLTSRCKNGIILANSELDRRGIRQDGPLWRALQPVLMKPTRSAGTRKFGSPKKGK